MNTRRTLLSGALVLAGTAAPFATSQGGRSGEGKTFPQSPTEAAAKVVPNSYQYPPGDVRRYGVIENNPNAATANVRALRRLVAPAGTFTGTISFPNTSDSDIYYLNDVIPFHDDIHVAL